MNTTLPFFFALYPLALAVIAFGWLFQSRQYTGLSWTIDALASGSIVAFLYLTGSWIFTSFYLRYALIGMYVLIAVASHRRITGMARKAATQKSPRLYITTLVLVLFAGLNAVVVRSSHLPEPVLNVSFPLASGTYTVLQGGSNFIANPFHALSGSSHALDLTKLNRFGNRASGIAPSDLSAYEIFADAVNSPCSGTVLMLRDGLPDNRPGITDTKRPEGNYVVLECGGVKVLMAHLKRGSIGVSSGEIVTTTQAVGRVGNSGNSMEPHLHIEAAKGEVGVPLRFDGRSLSINSIVHRVWELPATPTSE